MKLTPFRWRELAPHPVIGVDEVGRGCLAGPVYAAAVIIEPSYRGRRYQDSKVLSRTEREGLSELIFERHRVAIGIATVEEIFSLNIFHASFLAMKRAIAGLGVRSGHVLVDGKFQIRGLGKGFSQTALIKGDGRASPIGAASIVAKVARDKEMQRLSHVFSGYGFDSHKGYATPEHKQAISRLGPCEIHRGTFAGVREFLTQTPGAQLSLLDS